jgi:hypothetical protein
LGHLPIQCGVPHRIGLRTSASASSPVKESLRHGTCFVPVIACLSLLVVDSGDKPSRFLSEADDCQRKMKAYGD